MTPPTSDTTRRTVLRGSLVAAGGTVAALSVRGVARATAELPTASADAALASATACTTLTPEETQGPFWVDERLLRSDVRADSATGAVQAGVPLTLTINLQDAGADCSAQVGAYLDIWHANAQGTYSDVSGSGNPDNTGVDWLRGYQVSDANGSVTFTTIMPAGTPAGPSTSTSGSGSAWTTPPRSTSPPSCSSTSRSTRPCWRRATTRSPAPGTRPTARTRCTTRACSSQ